jgi:hypothetical protein
MPFEFVMQARPGSTGFSSETKTQIRSHAMKAVSAQRRQTGRQTKTNLLQLPPDVEPDCYHASQTRPGGSPRKSTLIPQDQQKRSSGKRRKAAAAAKDPEHMSPLLALSAAMPASGIQKIIQEYGIDLVDLSALTHVHIGAVAAARFASDPVSLPRLLACRQESYLDHLYPRYGHTPALDDALKCLLMKAQQVLGTQQRVSSPAKIWSAYSRAIISLQESLRDANSWNAPDLLCAAEMLSLFEVAIPLYIFIAFTEKLTL